MAKKKPFKTKPKQDNKQEQFPDVSIGESPVEGLTLKYVLSEHAGLIWSAQWSPDGKLMASGSEDGNLLIWNVANGELINEFPHPKCDVYCVSWSPDSRLIATCTHDSKIQLWDIIGGKLLKTIRDDYETNNCVSWSREGRILASGSNNGNIRLWNTENGNHELTMNHNTHQPINCISWSPDNKTIISGSNDNIIRVWNPRTGELTLKLLGHFGDVDCISWSPDGKLMASGSTDNTIRFWNIEKYRQTKTLEGHTDNINFIYFSPDSRLLVSKSRDHTVKIWKTDTGELLVDLPEQSSGNTNLEYAGFHPSLPYLATFGERDRSIRIWQVDAKTILERKSTESTFYTTAKLILVGDSGVGKTGLGWRLAHGEYKEHSSTHGQQFWVIDELGTTRSDGTQCEAVLWDLAGQPDYRLVHSLFLDDVDIALVLYDPTNRQEPLSGVDFWNYHLKGKKRIFANSLLIGARSDRGSSTLTVEELEAYCERNDMGGGYLLTSAKTGAGIDELIRRLKALVPWEDMTATVTTKSFKRIKEYVLKLKEESTESKILVQPNQLRKQLQRTDPNWSFTDIEMMTAVKHLVNHGYVSVLRRSDGTQTILLTPDLLANLASSVVLEARRNPRGLGVLEENRLLEGGYAFPELQELDEEEKEILLDAVAVLFLKHTICFRETFNEDSFLVFPSLINEKRPKDKNFVPVEGASYLVRGAVENVYASLVVLLGYSNIFVRTHQWQNQAQYEMGENEVCGFKLFGDGEGEIELVLYFEQPTPEPVRLAFRGLFERFLSRNELEILRYQAVICPKCGRQLARAVVMELLSENELESYCNKCGNRLSLPDPTPLTKLSSREQVIIDTEQAVAVRRTAFEAALVRVKALLRDRDKTQKPSCFISYSWGIPKHEKWVVQLANDLLNAGISVLLDRWHSPPGTNLDEYIDRILSCDFVIPVGTFKLREKYINQETDAVVAAELKLINLRIRQPTTYGHTVLSVLLDGNAETSFTPQLQPLVCIDFREESLYFRKLFDMIWRMYDLSFENPLLEELRESMSPQRDKKHGVMNGYPGIIIELI